MSKHWERKAVGKTASKNLHCERMKLIRYRNPGEKELEQFQQEKKKSREKKSRENQEKVQPFCSRSREETGNSFICVIKFL